jgi:RimJ/RimL family protein N-acetyltransferase
MTEHEAFELSLPTKILGNGLILLAYEDGDGQALFDLAEDNRDMLETWMYWAAGMRTKESFDAFVRRSQSDWLLRKEFCFGVLFTQSYQRGERDFIGGCSLFNAHWAVPSFELGYFIDGQHQRKGFASEVARLLTKYAFEHLKARRIWASADARNAGSIGAMKAAGLVQEATLRSDRLTPKGELRDTVICATVRE